MSVSQLLLKPGTTVHLQHLGLVPSCPKFVRRKGYKANCKVARRRLQEVKLKGMNLQCENKTSEGPQGSEKVDWQTTKLTIRERNAFMFNNSLMSDVSFVVKSTAVDNLEGARNVKTIIVPAHKYVLAVSSPVFYAMFYSGIAEVHKEISLPDCDSQSLLDFLRYLYSDEIEIIPANVLGVMYLAKKYMVPCLVDKCATFLAECLDDSNALEIWMQARRFEVEELQQRCLEIIDVYTTACLDTDGLFSLNHDAIVSLLQRETLVIDEYCLFKKIVQWAKSKCQQQGSLQEGSEVRKFIGARVINLIRFPTMKPEQFAEGVALSGILKEDEVVDVFLYFSSKDPTTSECAFKTAPRVKRKMI